MLEELNVQITVTEFIEKSIAPAGELTIELRGYWAIMAESDVLASTDHDEFRWVSSAEIEGLNWAPADLPIVAEVKRVLSA
jgi:8-oxo-dGTP diphosphatase